MNVEQLPLARQVDLAFRQMAEELSTLNAGTVFLHIRNNRIGKFGVRHYTPSDWTEGEPLARSTGLTESQIRAFRNMAIEALKLRRWSHGEAQFEFAVRNQLLSTSIHYESHYNIAALDPKLVRQ